MLKIGENISKEKDTIVEDIEEESPLSAAQLVWVEDVLES
jgi:hypothetical protein